MATAKKNCSICELRHVTNPSVSWCPECDEGFCSGCVEHHSLAKASRHHKTIPMAEYQMLPPDVLQILQSCTKHDEKFLLYCKDHELPCCGKCAIEVHKGCHEVVNLDDIIKNAKTSTSFQEVEETLDEFVANIKEIQKVYRRNITTLSENRKDIEKQIQEIRFKIDTHLNQLQKKLVDELQEVEETETRKVSQLIKTLEEKENNLTKYQILIANIKHHASNLQTFMSIKQIEQDLANEDEFIQSCLEGVKVKTRVITSKIEKNVETFKKNVQKFGEITVVIKPTKADLRERKKMQAQKVIPKVQPKPSDNIKTRLQDTIQTTLYNVSGCCILPDGRMAFTCFRKEMLILIKADGTKDFEILVTGAYDVTNGITNNTVIVSSCVSKKGINIVDIQYRKIRKYIPVQSNCYGLVERNGSVIFCTVSEIKILNIQTETVNTISIPNLSTFSCVDTNRTNMYYTSYSDHSVTCSDFQGAVKWAFKDENILKNPVGITVDDDDFLFVISKKSVVLISLCGKQHRTLLSSSDGLCDAQALHYDKARDILLVAQKKEKAFLYKIDRN
ncbi:tripartite motif-containing protein 5-like [Mytilus edulis]|uniref:tripartite motif-containing protein 5-like n=1 Tax=Mytilus edulis TaxID=6550 RepID=UPI0039EEDCC8